MNLLFLTLAEISDISRRGIYQDLMRKFISEGHSVTIITPVERRRKLSTQMIDSCGAKILQVKTFNIQKSSIIEKGIGTLAIEYQYLLASKIYLRNTKFDLILYTTPPVTLARVIQYFKKRDQAYAYLLLKDIFPQNAVDIKLLRKGGLLHHYFQRKEKSLYQISDTIGCMSDANVKYLLTQNPYIDPGKVEVNPNSIEPFATNVSIIEKIEIRRRFELPEDKVLFIYGGNLGKPQGLDFLLETIEKTDSEQAYFLVVGDGTEFKNLQNWFTQNSPTNARLIKHLSKEEYDLLMECCDVGMIFLDRNFTIPNFPSRLLAYFNKSLPVIAATDPSSDVGDVLEKFSCGYKVLAGDLPQMNDVIRKMILEDDLKMMGGNALKLLKEEYLVDRSYKLINDKIH